MAISFINTIDFLPTSNLDLFSFFNLSIFRKLARTLAHQTGRNWAPARLPELGIPAGRLRLGAAHSKCVPSTAGKLSSGGSKTHEGRAEQRKVTCCCGDLILAVIIHLHMLITVQKL